MKIKNKIKNNEKQLHDNEIITQNKRFIAPEKRGAGRRERKERGEREGEKAGGGSGWRKSERKEREEG